MAIISNIAQSLSLCTKEFTFQIKISFSNQKKSGSQTYLNYYQTQIYSCKVENSFWNWVIRFKGQQLHIQYENTTHCYTWMFNGILICLHQSSDLVEVSNFGNLMQIIYIFDCLFKNLDKILMNIRLGQEQSLISKEQHKQVHFNTCFFSLSPSFQFQKQLKTILIVSSNDFHKKITHEFPQLNLQLVILIQDTVNLTFFLCKYLFFQAPQLCNQKILF
ncbi:unnamed protein product [Paramecium octaurelia]|uniref:Uncharacterized protein n=1 Tax=Paramecium octaurelia TaxID=43137 RepID=A0A8S1YIX8_PAROT|nr:unnamed protein product [Paramecium octaurelia]